MSDYTPITGELRDAMCKWGWVERDGSIMFTTSPIPTSIDAEQSLVISGSDFDRLCDAIDAIHAGLERENAELRAARGDDWIKLPVDADGLPIHVGDMLAGEKAGGFGLCEPFEVGCILFGRDIVRVNDVHGLERRVEFAHHQRPDTWERIIEDARTCTGSTGSYTSVPTMRWTNEMDALVARCKALAGDAS